MKKILFTFLLAAMILPMFGQGFALGIKAGPTVGFQQWQGFGNRDPLFGYHGAISVETIDTEENAFSLYAQAGYHQRGSANRYVNIRINGTNNVTSFTDQFVFNNASLQVGAKKKFDLKGRTAYYVLGVRGDYNINTNLEELAIARPSLTYPNDFFVRKVTYGATFGGGFEFMFGELVGATLDLTINPDFVDQYQQPPIPNVTNPFTGNPYTIPENNIKNVTLEITLGLRLMRIVTYSD